MPSFEPPTNPRDARPLDESVRTRIRQRLRTDVHQTHPNVDGILLLHHANVVWASGFDHSHSERPVGYYIPVEGEPFLFVPKLEAEHAEEAKCGQVETYFEFPGEEHPVPWMYSRILQHRGSGTRIAIDHLDGALLRDLEAAGVSLTFSSAADRVRSVKESEELSLIRLAAHYADLCLAWMLEYGGSVVSDGGTELDLLRDGVDSARQTMNEALGKNFPVSQLHVVGTVHSGPRAALPHGRTGPRVPQSGESVIAGIGAKVGGYHAESGVTFCIDTPSDDTAHCLAAADACRRAAIEATRPGASCESVHVAAMQVLHDAALTPYIRHRIGHAMGVEGHEAPWLAPGDATVLEPGMAFSNEPGIYRPGIDGYRTIESIVVTSGNAEVASKFQSTVPWQSRILRTY